MIKYCLFLVILLASFTVSAQVKITKDKLDAHPASHYDILQALAGYYKLKLDLKSPRAAYNTPLEATVILTHDTLSILTVFHNVTGMDYLLKKDTLTVGWKQP